MGFLFEKVFCSFEYKEIFILWYREQNTWEPAENLEACQHLLKAFEENLSKQSVNKSKPLARKNEHGMNQAGPSGLNSFG